MDRALAVVLLALALLVGGYEWGVHATNNAWQAKDAARLKSEADARESEIRRGEKASGALQAQLLQQAIDNDNLTKAFNDYKKRNPILARPSAAPSVAAASAPGAACDSAAARSEPAVTLGAVWMWNSALFGRDTPAGACGLADQTEGACGADAGVSLQDAWDNQALNARLCAEDRLRHERLIDFLTGRTQ